MNNNEDRQKEKHCMSPTPDQFFPDTVDEQVESLALSGEQESRDRRMIEQLYDVYQSKATENDMQRSEALSRAWQRIGQNEADGVQNERAWELPVEIEVHRPVKPVARGGRLGRIVGTLVAVLLICTVAGSAFVYYGVRQTGGASAPKYAVVVATTMTGKVYALRSDNGSVLWTHMLEQFQSDATSNGVVVAGQTAYVANGTHVYALNAQNGALKWETAVTTLANSQRIFRVDNGIVYLSQEIYDNGTPGILDALSASNGKLLWSKQGEAQMLLAAADGIVYTNAMVNANAASGWVLEAIEGRSGTVLWHKAVRVMNGAAVGGTVYLSLGDDPQGSTAKAGLKVGLVALDGKSGSMLWSQIVDNYQLVPGENVIVYNRLPSFHGPQQFCALRSSNGEQMWCINGTVTTDPYPLTPYNIVGDRLYITETAGEPLTCSIEAYRLSDGKSLWSQPCPTKKVAAGAVSKSSGGSIMSFAWGVEGMVGLNGALLVYGGVTLAELNSSGKVSWNFQLNPNEHNAFVAVAAANP